MSSPYDQYPEQEWAQITRNLVDDYPLDFDDIIDAVLDAWDAILSSKIAGELQIGVDILPSPQIMGNYLHELIPIMLERKFPGQWSRDIEKSDKDLVYLPNRYYSTEIKTSSNPNNIYGNASYGQEDSSNASSKSKDGYYMEAEKHSLFWNYISETARHDFAAINGPELARQAKLLDGFYVTFTVNKTEKPFVLSMCGIYSFKYRNANHVILPISPTIAITLIEKGAGNFLIDNDIKHMYLLENESIIDQFNMRAFNTQCQEGYGYVISHDKNVLEELMREKKPD